MQDEPQREQVGPRIDVEAAKLFRRHVHDRSKHDANIGQKGLCRPGHGNRHPAGVGSCRGLREPEIEDLRTPRREKDVGRLDVAVDDALGVRGIEGIGQRKRDVYGRGKIQRPPREPLLQRLAFEELHREIGWIRSDVEDRADVRMIEGGCGACLPAEALERLLIRRQVAGEDLDGDGAVQPRVSRAIHLPHATGAEWFENLVRAKPIASGERHRGDYGPHGPPRILYRGSPREPSMGNTCASAHIALTGATPDAIEGIVRAYATLGFERAKTAPPEGGKHVILLRKEGDAFLSV